LDAQNKITLMRGHHFNFGGEPLTYETTAKNKQNTTRFKQPTSTQPEP